MSHILQHSRQKVKLHLIYQYLQYTENKTSISKTSSHDCVKSVRIRSFCIPYFSAFRLNTERYGVSLRIQSKYGKMPIRKAPNTDTFHAVHGIWYVESARYYYYYKLNNLKNIQISNKSNKYAKMSSIFERGCSHRYCKYLF